MVFSVSLSWCKWTPATTAVHIIIHTVHNLGCISGSSELSSACTYKRNSWSQVRMLISVLWHSNMQYTNIAVSFNVLYVLYVAGCLNMLLANKVTQMFLTGSRSQSTNVYMCSTIMYVALGQFIPAAMFSCSWINLYVL